MRRLVLIIFFGAVLAACFWSPNYGQTPGTRRSVVTASRCTVPLSDAPKIHGLYLGMTADEFLQMFPSAQPRRSPLGGNEISYEVRDTESRYLGTDYVWLGGNWFADERLYYVSFDYPHYKASISMSEFVRQVSKTLSLPSSGWRIEYGINGTLRCQGFTVMIGLRRVGEQGETFVSLQDDMAYAKVIARDKERKRLKAEELRRERKQRRIFKP